jgi:hypothetical protein
MTTNGWLQIAFYSIVLLALTKPMGQYILKVYDGSMTWLRPIERFHLPDHRSLRDGAGLPRHPGQGRNRGLQRGDDVRSP